MMRLGAAFRRNGYEGVGRSGAKLPASGSSTVRKENQGRAWKIHGYLLRHAVPLISIPTFVYSLRGDSSDAFSLPGTLQMENILVR
jgi:hypothetical protein